MEDIYTIFQIQIWLPDFIMGIDEFMNLTARSVWAEIPCYVGNKTIIYLLTSH